MSKKVLVVAHPDDEILWLSSVVDEVDLIVFCYGDLYGNEEISNGRRAVIPTLPFKKVMHLEVPEAGVYSFVNWGRPKLTEYGIDITNSSAESRYRGNYQHLYDMLHGIITQFDIVYTHNPWGEYGHAEHIQIYRIIESIQTNHACSYDS